jgi:SAM-dependent methyltransferase
MNEQAAHRVVYRPQVFEARSIAHAMRIVVTREEGTTAEERWVKETPFLVEDSGRCLGIGPDSCVLDYGCGIGRVAKRLIDRFGCRVVGVDFSASMRLLAPEYVLSERFTVWSPELLDKMIGKGFRADAALCIWVIQHVLEPEKAIQQIGNALRRGGLLYALNQETRCVPTNVGWVDDGYQIRKGLCATFEEVNFHCLPLDVTIPELAAMSMIQILRRKSEFPAT